MLLKLVTLPGYKCHFEAQFTKCRHLQLSARKPVKTSKMVQPLFLMYKHYTNPTVLPIWIHAITIGYSPPHIADTCHFAF